MARRQPRGPETRDRIVSSATDLFTSRGYVAVTVDEIARDAGVTKGAFYYWFADKADAARDVRHAIFHRVTTEALLGFDPESDTLTAMQRGFERFLDSLAALDDAREFLRETWRMTADVDGPFDQEVAVDLVAGMFRSAQARGEATDFDPTTAATLFVGGCSELALHVMDTGERDHAVATVNLLLDALRSPHNVHPMPANTTNETANG